MAMKKSQNKKPNDLDSVYNPPKFEGIKNKLCVCKATLTSSLFTIMNEVNNKILQNIEIFDFVLFCEVLIT